MAAERPADVTMMHPTPTPFTGRAVIVTGASRGIGAATAKAFAAAGGAVTVAARDEVHLAAVVDEITARGGRALSVPTDVSDPAAVERLVTGTVEEYGRLDIAFNNAAGGGHRPTPLAEVDVGDFDSGIAITLRGMFLCMRYEIAAMLNGGGGAIVNMSSTAGLEAVGGLASYSAAKHGVIALTKVAALDYAERGIRVNAIAPGPILTERLAEAGEEMQRRAGAAMPARRIGRVEEVAAAVLWLSSDAASYVTGVTLPIDGGMLAGTPPFSSRGRGT
jgi:NAD(P)-dependent dehydrogenase (short-subunit alcohol dehydrogenase family)